MRCIVVLALGCLVGCGSAAPQMSKVGLEEEIERSRDARPEWLGAVVCPEGKVCAVGSRTRAATVEFGRTDAFNDGLKDFARRLETRAKSKFQQGRAEGRLPDVGESPEVDQAIQELFVAASKLRLRDVQVADFWWRRYRALGSDGRHRSYYDYSVQITVDCMAWKKAVQDLIDRQRRKASQGQHEALVKTLDAFAEDILTEEE